MMPGKFFKFSRDLAIYLLLLGNLVPVPSLGKIHPQILAALKLLFRDITLNGRG